MQVSPLKSTLLSGFILFQVSCCYAWHDVKKFTKGFSGQFNKQLLTDLLTELLLSDVPDHTWIRLHLSREPRDGCQQLTRVKLVSTEDSTANILNIDPSGRVYGYVRKAGDLQIHIAADWITQQLCYFVVEYTAAVVLHIDDKLSRFQRTIPYWEEFNIVSHSEYGYNTFNPWPPSAHIASISILGYKPCSRIQVTVLDYEFAVDIDNVTLTVGDKSKHIISSELEGFPLEVPNYEGDEIKLQLHYDSRTRKDDKGFLLKYEVLDDGCTLTPNEALVVRHMQLLPGGNCSYRFQCSPPGLTGPKQPMSMSCLENKWIGLSQCNYTVPDNMDGQDRHSGDTELNGNLTAGLAAGIPLILLLIVAVLLAAYYLHTKHRKHEQRQVPATAEPIYYNGGHVTVHPNQADTPTYQNASSAPMPTSRDPPPDEDHTYYNDLPSATSRPDNRRKFRDIGEEYTTVEITTNPSTTPIPTPTPIPRSSTQLNPRVQFVENDLYNT